MRCAAWAVLLLLVGCDVVTPPDDEPFFELEVLSPLAGETRNLVRYRVRLRGYSMARVAAATPQQPDRVVAFRTGCEGPPETCEGELVFPALDADVEVWGEYVDPSGAELESPRQVVHINTMPVVLAQLSRTPTRITWLVTGQNNLDPATLGNLRVTRDFPVTDTMTSRADAPGFTATLRGSNKLDVDGPFVGPATYQLDFSGVTNAFGTPLPNREVVVDYFEPVVGAPTGPAFPTTLSRLERATDGTIALVHAGGVSRVGASGVQPLATWTDAHLGTVDRAGTPYRLMQSSATTVDVERWNGAGWVALPQVTVPTLTSLLVHKLELAFDAADTPFLLAAVCGQGSPGCDSARVLRFDGAAWGEVYAASFTRATSWLELFSFGDSVALFFNERTATGEFPYAPTMLRYGAGAFTPLPTPVGPHVGAIPATFPILPGAVKSDARGHAFVLAGMAGFIDLDLLAVLEWDGAAWTVRDDGTRSYFAHTTLGDMPKYVMDLSAMWVDAWDLTPAGDIVVFTWEQSGQGLELRFHAGAYLLSGSTWSALPGVGSPIIATGLRVQSVLYQSPAETWVTTRLSGTTPSALLRH